MALLLFFILAFLSAGGVVGMIVSRDRAHSVLFLVLAFAALGGVFGLLDAPFVAAIQVLIYAGAILVLFVFVIMMIDRRDGRGINKKKSIGILAAVLAIILFAELLLAVRGILPGMGNAGPAGGSETARLGSLLFEKYLYPLEITSILIIAALTGAISLAGKKGPK
jgi:NADH-quinone oxidoreductase subunit J